MLGRDGRGLREDRVAGFHARALQTGGGRGIWPGVGRGGSLGVVSLVCLECWQVCSSTEDLPGGAVGETELLGEVCLG